MENFIFCAVRVASIFQTISIGSDLICLRNEEKFNSGDP